MDRDTTSRAVIGLLALSILLAISVITGVGIETRDLSVFPSWQASMFMYGGPIMIILSLVAIGTVVRWTKIGAPLAIVSAILSILFSAVGVALLGAPEAPLGVTVVDGIHMVIAAGIVYLAVMMWRKPAKVPSSPASV